ncbi:MAG: hypothetical protein OXC42_08555 [Gammaproteobacteria bacterium]|nr:hypothetical protein [Gammaproteobacteria bacterium]
MRDQLNNIIAEAEIDRGLTMPRIGTGHAQCRGGIFSLLQDPGSEHTAGSGAEISRVVDICNDDPTARYCRDLFERIGIPKSVVTPWNAYGAYGEKPGMKAISENLPLCQRLVDAAGPAAIIAQGREAQKMADRLRFDGPVFRVPHPSRRGRASYKGAAKDIETAFEEALRICTSCTEICRVK